MESNTSRWLLHGLLGRELEVIAGSPSPRPTLSTERLLLPDLEPADALAAVAHAVAHLRHSVPARRVGDLKPMTIAVVSALEDARVERLLARELPGVRRWFAQGIARSRQEENLSFAGLMIRLDRALTDPARRDGNFWVEKARALFEEQAAEDLEDYAAFRRIASVLANDLGQLRVPFRAQQYVVPVPYRDDHGYLWDLPDPPEAPVPIHFTSESPPPGDPPSASEPQEPREAPETELGRYCYPEWDARIGLEREDWTTVIEKRPAWRIDQPGKTTAESTPRLVLRAPHRFARAQRRRAFEGEHLHLDSAIDTMIACRTRRSPDARLFLAGGSQAGAGSVLVLLDLSASTNDAVRPGGPPLLALVRAAARMLAEAVAAAGTGDRLAIHGFHSDGRENVSYYRLVDFGAPFGPLAQAMLDQAPARLSTRMGAALRHATRCLAAEKSAHRGVLVVTDGAPSDIDVHLPGYLVEDTRAAVQAARRLGIRVHALAVDPVADLYVRRIFGVPDFGIVDRPDALAARLRAAYARLCHG